MTRKHFIALASALKYAHEQLGQRTLTPDQVIDELTEDIAIVCAQSNEHFDRQRFYAAAAWRTDR